MSPPVASGDVRIFPRPFVSFLYFLLPLALAGLALINTGLSRLRSAAHSMMAALCVVGVAAAAYFVTGFAWQGYPGLASHTLSIFGKEWSWLGAGHFFLRGVPLDGSRASLAALLQLLSVGLAALIPLGAAAERWRLRACCLSTALLAGITYPLFAHWVWGGGWLERLGANYGLGLGFLDAGGSSTIQAVGGLTALSMVWLLGPRRGKYNPEGMPAALPGHNTVSGALRLPSRPGGLDGIERRRFASLCRHSPGANRPGGGQYSAVGWRCGAGRSRHHPLSLWQARRLAQRQRLGQRTGGFQRRLRLCSAGRGALDRTCRRRAGDLHRCLDGSTPGIGRPRGSGLCPRAWRHLGNPGRGPFPSRGILAAASAGVVIPASERQGGQMLAQVVGVATLLGFVLPFTYSLNWLLNRFYPSAHSPGGGASRRRPL